MRHEPAFRLLELPRRIAELAFAVELDQIRVPLPVDALRQNVGGLALAAELHEAARRRARYFRMNLGRVRKTTPIVAKPGSVVGDNLELFALSADANVL